MNKLKYPALLMIAAILSFSCAAPSQSGNAEPRPQTSDEKVEWCSEWDRRVALLTQEERNQLKSDGVALGGHDSVVPYGYYILNSDKVADCKKRVRFGEIVEALVGGRATDEDNRYLAESPKEFMKIVGSIWNAPGFSTDGAVHEKYLILEAPGLDDETVGEFVRELLRSQGVSSDLIWVISQRKLTSLTRTLDDGFKAVGRTKNVQQQALFLIALYQHDRNKERAVQMRKFASAKGINPTGKKAVLKVSAAMDRGETINPVDCEAVEAWLEPGEIISDAPPDSK